MIYGHCVAGIAAYEQLDIEAADESFQTALRLARETLGNRSSMPLVSLARYSGS